MQRLWISSFTHYKDRTSFHIGTEFDYAHVGVPLNAVLALLSRRRASVEGKDQPKPAWAPRHCHARTIVIKRLIPTAIDPLQPVNVTPGHTPGPKVLSQITRRLFERANLEPGIFVIAQDNGYGDAAGW